MIRCKPLIRQLRCHLLPQEEGKSLELDNIEREVSLRPAGEGSGMRACRAVPRDSEVKR